MPEMCRKTYKHLCRVDEAVPEEIASTWPVRPMPNTPAWAGKCLHALNPPWDHGVRFKTYENSVCRLKRGHSGAHDMTHQHDTEIWYLTHEVESAVCWHICRDVANA